MTEPDRRTIAGASLRVFHDGPSWDGLRAATIGELAVSDPGAGAALLQATAESLSAQGYGAVIGPMDGDTWHRYRVVVSSDGSAPYLMEPTSGPHDLAALQGAGFVPISEYVSARAPVAGPDEKDAQDERFEARAWNGENAEGLIGGVYDISRAAFADNAFYKPIAREDFLAMYAPIMQMIDPRLVLFAYDRTGAVCGFLFGMPDLLAPVERRCAILKTYASAARGVGRLLAQRFHLVARDLGFAGVIHALMHVDNASRERSGRHAGAEFRRYALMGRRL